MQSVEKKVLETEDAAPGANGNGVEKAKMYSELFQPITEKLILVKPAPSVRMSRTPDPVKGFRGQMAAALSFLHPDPAAAIELSAIGMRLRQSSLWEGFAGGGKKAIVSGWFQDRHKLIEQAIALDTSDAKPVAVYVTLNPVTEALLSRGNHRLQAGVNRTSGKEITRRTNMLVDVDPKRPEGVSSSESEKRAAFGVVVAVRNFLRGRGWPEPMTADSGNGYHLIYKVDLPNSPESQKLVELALKALNQKFGTNQADVDTGVHDAPRLIKLYYTTCRKGDDTKDRPHRLAAVSLIPQVSETVSDDLLKQLAAEVVDEKIEQAHDTQEGACSVATDDGTRKLKVPEYLADHGYELKETKALPDGATMFCLEHCVFDSSHNNGQAAITQKQNGELSYFCYHNSCKGKQWKDARAEISGKKRLTKWMTGERKKAGYVNDASQDELALVFAERHENVLRFDHNEGIWYKWDGTRWCREETKLAFEWARTICRESAYGPRGGKNKGLLTAKTASAVEQFARSDRRMAITSDRWDLDKFLLGTATGVVDLRTGEARDADPADFMTKQATVAPADKADCPLWRKFLDEATQGDVTLQRFMQQIAGYSLTGDICEHALFFVYGPGGNGKSVFLNTISNIMGEYAKTAPMETFTKSFGERHPNDVAMLRGARLVTASETEEGKAWAESKIKSLTGGDKVSARFMRQNFFEFSPQFKLLIVGNHQPVLNCVDDAAKRRFHIIPFVHRPEKVDKELEHKLRAEYPGILRWMIDGCLDWQANGLLRPDVVDDATKEYFSDQDLMAQWIAEKCEIGSSFEETVSVLYQSWTQFLEDCGEKENTKRTFGDNLVRHGFLRHRTAKGRFFRGLRLIEEAF